MGTRRKVELDTGNLRVESRKEWLRLLSKSHPEIGYPGYWNNLESNIEQWSNELSVNRTWRKAETCLARWRAEFKAAGKGTLLSTPRLPNFVAKGIPRIKEKLLLKFQEDGDTTITTYFPKGRAPVPNLSDLVRTRVSCSYIDGVEFLSEKLISLFTDMGCTPTRERQGRIEGYYAQHINFTVPLFYHIGKSQRQVEVSCEVQVATHLSTRVWEATHSIYEKARVKKETQDDWQWSPGDYRFVSRQLGHMIHLADGLLCQIRDGVTIESEGE